MPDPHDQHEIHPGELFDDRRHVLKKDDTFVILDRRGDVQPLLARQQGLFHGGTRFLSRFALRLSGHRPLLLDAGVMAAEARFHAELTNPDVIRRERLVLPRGQLHLQRRLRVAPATLFAEVAVRNFGRTPARFDLELWYAADFADLFELRGERRERCGIRAVPRVEPPVVIFEYQGLDGQQRATRVCVDGNPSVLDARRAVFRVALEPGATQTFAASVHAGPDAAGPVWLGRPALHPTPEPIRLCRIESSNLAFDAWLERSSADLNMLLTQTPSGPYPYAGVPWFSTPFGRDALVTGMETLWCAPSLSAGVLRFLAASQAREDDPQADAEPGKIVHEMRAGEMAATGEIPFGRYYGSVDVTPLFVMLAGMHHERTGDDALAAELWPHVERALGWMEDSGDADGDGFIEYARRSREGLSNQGWKDSVDSVSHEDGALATGPIALCEVQAYAYAARTGAARLARRLGHEARAEQLDRDAVRLREAFGRAYWDDALQSYALALDGEKRPCRVSSSNAGHALFAGIAQPEHAEALTKTLLAPPLFSGWGVRTLSTRAQRYNPMSYHNGSVWPHDSALVAAGLARYGHVEAASRIFEGLFAASHRLEDARLPELFCGFERESSDRPIPYPGACELQAWASGAVFLLLQAMLGLSIDADRREVRLLRPCLPPFLDWLTLRGVRIGEECADLRLERAHGTTGVAVLRRTGSLRVALLD